MQNNHSVYIYDIKLWGVILSYFWCIKGWFGIGEVLWTYKACLVIIGVQEWLASIQSRNSHKLSIVLLYFTVVLVSAQIPEAYPKCTKCNLSQESTTFIVNVFISHLWQNFKSEVARKMEPEAEVWLTRTPFSLHSCEEYISVST